jgi:hypothetical protein
VWACRALNNPKRRFLTRAVPETARTYNLKNLSKNGDWTRYHPWRAPGHAPVSDPCGVAGAYTTSVGGGGETPPGAAQVSAS